jgi:hypothetical protein
MPTPSSGPISFLTLRNAFGVPTPTPINQMYRGGAYTPSIGVNNAVPVSGAISLQNFYSTWGRKTMVFTINVGSTPIPYKKGKGSYYGYGIGGLKKKGGSFGSISQDTFLTPTGTMVIEALYFSTGTNAWHLQLRSTAAPADSDLSFLSVSVSGYSINGVRSARTSTQATGTARRWNWQVPSASHPSSGTITCSINFYG